MCSRYTLCSIYQMYSGNQSIYRCSVYWKKCHWQWGITKQKIKKCLQVLLNDNECSISIKLDEGCYIFWSVGDIPMYFEAWNKDLLTMVHQLDIPALFFISISKDKMAQLDQMLLAINGSEGGHRYIYQKWNDMDRKVSHNCKSPSSI